VLKAWYGTPDAGVHFYKHEVQQLNNAGFTQQKVDPCMHTIVDDGGKLKHMLIHHVDDMLVFSPDNKSADEIEDKISLYLPIKRLGEPTFFLGIDIQSDPNGDVKLHQGTFIGKLLAKYEQYEIKERKTPAPTKRLQKAGTPTAKPYRSLLGSFIWINKVWPKLAYYTQQLTQFASCGTEEHWEAALHLLGYIKTNPTGGITIRKTNDPDLLKLRYYSDADFGGNYDLRSGGGYLGFVNGALVSWSCSKIRAVVTSVFESEIYMMSHTCREITWITRLMEAMQIKKELPIIIYCDNQGAICTSLNESMSAKTKHIRVRDLYVREATQEGLVRCQWIPSALNLADILTKPLGRVAFERLAHGIDQGVPPVIGKKTMEER
jgi:hypothetical protein